MQAISPAPGSAPPAAAAGTTDWRLVTVFYAVCMSLVSLLTFGLYLAGANMSTTSAQLTFQLTIAFLYMPAPLVSALIAERVGKRSPLIRTTFVGFGRKLPRLLLTYVGLSAAIYLAYLLFALPLRQRGAGAGSRRPRHDPGGTHLNITALFSEIAQSQGAAPPPPSRSTCRPWALLYVIALFSGLVAGVTINGLFAFGEEYGWRGFLMDELRPLGAVRANLLTGVLWGLFHAPIILLGYNFDPYRLPRHLDDDRALHAASRSCCGERASTPTHSSSPRCCMAPSTPTRGSSCCCSWAGTRSSRCR